MKKNNYRDYLGEGIPTFEIYCREDFDELRCFSIKSPIKIVIKNDIDMGGMDLQFEPIDLSSFPYPILISGSKPIIGVRTEETLADNKYKIQNMAAFGTVSGTGLFSAIGGSLTAKDLCFDGCSVSGQDNVGMLVGMCPNVTVIGCDVDNSTIYGGDAVGGLVGTTSSLSIDECSIYGEIEGNNYVGGLVGKVKNLTMKNTRILKPVALNNSVPNQTLYIPKIPGYAGYYQKINIGAYTYCVGIRVTGSPILSGDIRIYDKKKK